MLFRMKDEKAHQLEAQLDKLQADGPAAWAKLPEEELFTPAGFSEERAEATSYSNYSYWGSTFRAFFKNRIAVILLAALIAVVAFAFLQPYLPGQADPHLGRRTHQPDHRLLRGPYRGRRGHHGGRALGLCPPAGLLLYRAVQHL